MAKTLPRPEEPSEAAAGPTLIPVGKRKGLSLSNPKHIKAWTLYRATLRRRKLRLL